MQLSIIESANDRLADAVYQQILISISKDILKPGERLIQEQIAKETGVSRTPIREALFRLEREGTIENVPRKGFIIKKVSVQDIKNIFGAREAIEGYASFLVTDNLTPEKLEAIEVCVKKDPVGDLIDMETAFAINKSIHRSIVQQADNDMLLKFFDRIWNNPVVMRIFAATYTEQYQSQLSEHQPIFDAIKFGTPEKAQAVAIEHIRSGFDLHIESVS